jgi:hypothetical protein
MQILVVRAALPALVLLTAAACLGQSSEIVLDQNTVITGTCSGHEHDPGCVIPSLFGPTGLTLYPSPQFSHYAHFIGDAQEKLNQTLGASIATQLAILPIISPASGFTFKYDSSTGAFVRTSSSFGPIYSERAETVGRGRVSFGTSYQRFRFSQLDGTDLKNVPAVFTHVPGTGPGGADEPYESDVIATVNSLDLRLDQTTLYGTVGLTDRLDVSVAIPIVSVGLGASSNANIIRVSGQQVTLSNGRVIGNPHAFDAQGSLQKVFTNSGSATGIGDVTVRVKGRLTSSDSKVQVAAAVDIRTPTGDERKLLGSGATGVKPFLIVSAGKRFSPHLNIGYQWNGSSVLAGNITGATFGENAAGQATVTNGPPTKGDLPNQFFYSLGFDAGVTNRLTLDFDYLGQTLFDAPGISVTNFVTDNLPGGTGALTFPTIVGQTKTTTLNNGGVGFKYNLTRTLLLTADLLFRLDNHGLRQDVTPLIGLSYTFGG